MTIDELYDRCDGCHERVYACVCVPPIMCDCGVDLQESSCECSETGTDIFIPEDDYIDVPIEEVTLFD